MKRHLERFWVLMNALDDNTTLSEEWLKAVEAEDSLFPCIQPADWVRVSP